MKIVVSGDIGCGKSTAVRAAMQQLGWSQPAGFFTHWGTAGRGASELYLSTWSGETQVVARRVAKTDPALELPFEVDLALFNRVAVASLAAAAGPVVVDELGVLESGAADLVAALVQIFRGPRPVLAVIQRRALERWLEIIGSENVGHRIEVDSATRNEQPGKIVSLFRA
jgi:nucleoside-triphosphatase THEP1